MSELSVEKNERAILVGLATQNQPKEVLMEYLDELAFLALTAGAETVEVIYQNLTQPDKRTYVGKGKLEEIKQKIKEKDIDIAIFDDELSPSQQRNLEKELEIKVLDRPMLILDIFASRAQTVQAKTQVELAQYQYLLPRLKGLWTHLDRQKGGIGMRGTGEKEIETDRRVANRKIAGLKDQLKKIDMQNAVRRKNRGEMVRVALVGYTNVGKSTLMNAISKSTVLAENKLFATLDTTVRKVVVGTTPFLLSDTVGFIRKLPHHLVESFKSTLDEVKEADILVHVIDVSHDNFQDQIDVVLNTLKDLDSLDKEMVYVFNKIDQYRKKNYDEFLPEKFRKNIEEEFKHQLGSHAQYDCLFISALDKKDLATFRDFMEERVQGMYKLRYPYKTFY